MNDIQEKWNQIKESIRTEYELTNISYETWIAPLKLYKVENNVVTIMIPSDQAQTINYISNKYGLFFKVTISEIMDHEYDVTFILEKDTASMGNSEVQPAGSISNINYENANLNSKYKFDTFIVGSNNKFAHSAALAVAESPGEAYNPLYLYGGAGLGKTHLMHSIGHFVLEQNPNMKVLYVTSEQFTNEVIESIRSGNAAAMTKLREKYRTVDVLLIDDVQFIIGKESTQEEFFHTFNDLHSNKKQIIISSDKPPKEMQTLEGRLRSRFEWGLIVDISSPDYETRMAILRKKEELDGYQVNDDVIKYIATNIKSNIRELEGALNKLMACSRLEKKEITIEMAEQELRDIISPDEKREVTPELIINTVAEHFGIRPEDIKGKKRNSEIVFPRQIAMYLCREIIGIPLKSIVTIMGKKYLTTVINACYKIVADMEKSESTRNTVEIIKKKITPN